MKKYIRDLFFILLILLAFIAGGKLFYENTKLDDYQFRTVQYFIKEFFLFRDSSKSFSANQLILCFTAFLFLGYGLNVSLYGTTRKYRSMIMLRYGSRKKYFIYSTKLVALKSFILIATAVGCFCIASLVFNIPFEVSKNEVVPTILLIANVFLFLNLLGLINIFCVMKYVDTAALIVTSLLTGAMLLADAFESYFAIITFGNLPQEVRGITVLVISNVILFISASEVLKKQDIL